MKELDGAWEPRGYVGPRAEIREEKLTLLWRGGVVLTTPFSVEKEGEALVLHLKYSDKRYSPDARPYSRVTDCRLENGGMTITEEFPITGTSSDTLYPTQNTRYGACAPDENALRHLQGTWIQLDGSGKLSFREDEMTEFWSDLPGQTTRIVVLRPFSPGGALRVAERDSARPDGVGSFGTMTLRGDALETYIPVCDAPTRNIVFIKERKEEKTEPIPCGGTSDWSNHLAPKSIVSAEITRFLAKISLLSYNLDDRPVLTSRKYELQAEREGNKVACVRWRMGGEQEAFEESPAFLESLQRIVAKHELAKFNGLDKETHGLPENFGADLRVEYASGERISAHCNRTMFLPLKAVEDLVKLFYGEDRP